MYANDPTIDVAHLLNPQSAQSSGTAEIDSRSKDNRVSIGFPVFDERVPSAQFTFQRRLLSIKPQLLLQPLRLERFILQFPSVRIFRQLEFPPRRIGGNNERSCCGGGDSERFKLERKSLIISELGESLRCDGR